VNGRAIWEPFYPMSGIPDMLKDDLPATYNSWQDRLVRCKKNPHPAARMGIVINECQFIF